MALNDELYSRLVGLYQNLNDQKIHELNARLILLLTKEINDRDVLNKIFERLEIEQNVDLKKPDHSF
ncbi:DUF2783 domain-containing protein [Paracoccaceae bacterium]|nr:DUF2783 domain-containing protein [Paracoccaceae bacterium]